MSSVAVTTTTAVLPELRNLRRDTRCPLREASLAGQYSTRRLRHRSQPRSFVTAVVTITTTRPELRSLLRGTQCRQPTLPEVLRTTCRLLQVSRPVATNSVVVTTITTTPLEHRSHRKDIRSPPPEVTPTGQSSMRRLRQCSLPKSFVTVAVTITITLPAPRSPSGIPGVDDRRFWLSSVQRVGHSRIRGRTPRTPSSSPPPSPQFYRSTAAISGIPGVDDRRIWLPSV